MALLTLITVPLFYALFFKVITIEKKVYIFCRLNRYVSRVIRDGSYLHSIKGD